MNRPAVHLLLIAATALVPATAAASRDRISPQGLARQVPVIGVAAVERVEADATHEWTDCAHLVVAQWLRGGDRPWVLRTCYTTRSHIELGPGPRVRPGEEAVFFGSGIVDGELALADAYRGLVSPSNFSWTTATYGRPGATYRDFREATEWAVRFVDGSRDDRNRMIPELVDQDNFFVWEMLFSEARTADFDRDLLVRAVMGRYHQRATRRASALELLSEANAATDVRERFMNELLDLCLTGMEDSDVDVREKAYRIAKHHTQTVQPSPHPGTGIVFMVPRFDQEDFGYRPDGPPAERAAALERWRAWWAGNRGRGIYDREARIAEMIERERTHPQRMAELDRRLGEAIKVAIDNGRMEVGTLDDRQVDVLRVAGYEVAPDGSVVPIGTETADAGGRDGAADGETGDSTDADEQAAGQVPDAPPNRRGCGCAAPGGTTPGWMGIAAVALAATVAVRRFRRARSHGAARGESPLR